MRAVVFDSYGGPEVLRVDDVPEPDAGEGEVRVRVRAASINAVDLKKRSGALADGKPAAEMTQNGLDAAGVVEEVGDGVTDVAVGDEVLGVGNGAAQAESAVLIAWTAKPAELPWEEAAAIGLVGETAARGLTLLEVGADDTLFIDGASGGVGRIAVQLAAARGARVIGSAGRDKQDLVRSLGAEPVVYGEGVGDRVRALSERVDRVFDAAGMTAVEELIALVEEPRQVLTIANFEAGDTGIQLTNSGAGTDPLASLAEVTRRWREGKLRVAVDRVLPLESAADAHRAAEAGATKVVLVP